MLENLSCNNGHKVKKTAEKKSKLTSIQNKQLSVGVTDIGRGECNRSVCYLKYPKRISSLVSSQNQLVAASTNSQLRSTP